MRFLMAVVFIRIFLLVYWFIIVESKKDSYSCTESHDLVHYRVTFRGQWSEKQFPKQYPKYRPPALWSNLIGRSHNDDYRLWSKGSTSSVGFKQFAQEGKTTILDALENQGFNGILDTFTAPGLNQGFGTAAADFFASSNYTKVSIAVRIVPSPDWFAGVDSVELCRNGSWKKSVTVPLNPMDAGTDREGEDPAVLERKREELEEQLILAGEPLSLNRESEEGIFKPTIHTNRVIADKNRQQDSEETGVDRKKSRIQPIDCLVGNWGRWSACSKTCGFGAQNRHRKVVQIPKGGRSCPVLDQEKWCGSMRSCDHRQTVFSWLDKNKD